MQIRGRDARVGLQLQAQRTTWKEFAAALHDVEELGFDTVWTFDHMLPFSGPDDGPAFDTLTTLGAMAALTERIRIGVLVNGVLYRDPTTLAKSAATVDQISGGRLEFSLGAAWAEREFTTYGLPYPPLAERYERLEEALQIVRALWNQPRTDFHGRWYRVDHAPCEPKPVQQPHPPIMIGGSGLGSLRAAARYGDSSNVQGAPAACGERADRLQAVCAEEGRPFDGLELTWHGSIAIAATHEAAEAEARRILGGDGDFYAESDRMMIGTPDEIVARFHTYAALGFSHWIFGIPAPFDRDALTLLSREVLPALR